MKKSIIFLASLAMLVFISIETKAQTASASATANASARIVAPLEIMKDVDLAFGNIAAGPAAGTVTIATDGLRSGDGGITLITAGNVSHNAQFSIIGYPEATFSIALPSSIVLESNGNEMIVDQFVSDLGSASVLSAIGEATLNVGATLNVEANQAPGLYNGTFDVVIAYN